MLLQLRLDKLISYSVHSPQGGGEPWLNRVAQLIATNAGSVGGGIGVVIIVVME